MECSPPIDELLIITVMHLSSSGAPREARVYFTLALPDSVNRARSSADSALVERLVMANFTRLD